MEISLVVPYVDESVNKVLIANELCEPVDTVEWDRFNEELYDYYSKLIASPGEN